MLLLLLLSLLGVMVVNTLVLILLILLLLLQFQQPPLSFPLPSQITAFVSYTGGKITNPAKPLYLCGHSLGGALATLVYAHFTLSRDPILVNGVVTVGQPRVGTKKFKEMMQVMGPCVLQRIYNANDIVPTVPPTIEGYRHYGNR